MADAAVLLNISDMIDLAIGSPEVGVVDFCMLHTVLHCLAQQMRVLDKNVELRGSMAVLPNGQKLQDGLGDTLNVSEYPYDTTSKADDDNAADEVPGDQQPDQDTILVVERVKRSQSTSPPRDSTATEDASKDGRAASKDAGRGVVRGAGRGSPTGMITVPSSEKLSLVTISKFNVLENVVDDLKNRVYGSMPKNEAILEEVRSQTNLKGITDMWTSLNVSSRLEAAEEGLAKLSSLLQDLIGETASLHHMGKKLRLKPPVSGREDIASGIESSGSKATSGADSSGSKASPGVESPGSKRAGSPTSKADSAAGKKGYRANNLPIGGKAWQEAIMQDVEDLAKDAEQAVQDIGDLKNNIRWIYDRLNAGQTGQTGEAGETSTLPTLTGVLPREPPPPSDKTDPNLVYALNRLVELEKKMNKCCDTISKAEGVMQDQLSSFQDQLQALAVDVDKARGTFAGQLTPEIIKDLQGIMQLFQTVQDMQTQLADVHETALDLAAEKEDRQSNLQSLLEQIELLKTIKLDREDMEEALADKVDMRMLGRKVSHDQFEMACDDLSRGLEHAVGKLHVQESLWQQALDDIQREIETKLDKLELGPVKDFFNSKLRQLQDSIKQLASLRRQVEAAGTKKKLLSDVNCLSCDAQAVMTMEAPSSVPVSKPLPAHMSMKPYLSYELDTIRKAQMSNVPQRNMHDWEAIGKQGLRPKHPIKVRSESEKHLCNRYCGGSHTVTTAAQRVARTGHFVKQWGPEVLPLSTGMATGDDGRLYKVTTEAPLVAKGPGGAVEVIVPPQTPSKRKLEQVSQSKPIIITEECRCLDYDPVKLIQNKPKSANYGS